MSNNPFIVKMKLLALINRIRFHFRVVGKMGKFHRTMDDLPPGPEDVIKANLYLVGIIAAFVVLTFIAYLFNEGKQICVIPLLRKYNPKCKWVLKQDKLETENEEKRGTLD